MKKFTLPFSKITREDINMVGGKNASLGEMIKNLSAKGIAIPDGFSITAESFRFFLEYNNLNLYLGKCMNRLDKESLDNLNEVGAECRELFLKTEFPDELTDAIKKAYIQLVEDNGIEFSLAVRSSGIAEDSPTASFAGQHDSFLNVRGIENLLDSVKHCYASLYNDRAIKYRLDHGFPDTQISLSVGVQIMVRSDKGSAGVAFTLEPESGNSNFIYITGAWGLGESVVQGAVVTDEFYVFKPLLGKVDKSLIHRSLGKKERMIIYDKDNPGKTIATDTTVSMRNKFILDENEVVKLAEWCNEIEKHYGTAMDIEWAKDGNSGKLYIVQARPETVHTKEKNIVIKEFRMLNPGQPVLKGKAVGKSIVAGKVKIIKSLADSRKVNKGDIIVADITNPDWNALLRKAISIVTNKGGRTSHASIIARELGIPAIVGTLEATEKLRDDQTITVSCAEGETGHVYDGLREWKENTITPGTLKPTRTRPMLILADPGRAPFYSTFPNQGVGLLRMEFIISNSLQVHPMALARFDSLPETPEKKQIEILTSGYHNKNEFFVEKLSEAVAMVAASFYPKEVILRMSDFKTNEYAKLLGGKFFEPEEENPMLGFRGASRYYHEQYKAGFGLECEAVKRVREEMGFTNVKVMIPFCRTVEEAQKVLNTMAEFGLERGKEGLEVYVMAEIPSNIMLAKEFSELFDGFSIGSNDLTQLTLGLDRDSAIISDLFNERNESITILIRHLIKTAHHQGVKVGLCGQAPSDYPEFAQFLVKSGIDSISFNPDALITGIQNIIRAEEEIIREEKVLQ